MGDVIVSLVVGGVFASVGVFLISTHVKTWKRYRDDPVLTAEDRAFYRAQYRRRLQTSGMIVLIGLLVPLGDWLPVLKRDPGWFGLYWLGVLILTLWMCVMAFSDLFSTKTHSRAALARLRRQQRELEEQAARLRQHQTNGHPPTH